MLTVLFFRRTPSVLEQLRGQRPRIHMVLGTMVAGVPLVLAVRKRELTALRRDVWSRTAKELAEFLLPPPAPRLLDGLRAHTTALDPLATLLLHHFAERGWSPWKLKTPLDAAVPDDVLAACLTTPMIAKVKP